MNLLAAIGVNQLKFNCNRIISLHKIWIVLTQLQDNYFYNLSKAIGQILI